MRHRDYFLSLLFLILPLAGVGLGQENKKLDQVLTTSTLPKEAAAPMEQRMSKMEEVLKQQNQEIDTLRKQLSAQEEGRLNKARAEEIRQMVKEILSDKEFTDKIFQPTLQAGYDHGFFIRTADDAFYLKTRIRTQFRYSGINRQSDNRNILNDAHVHDSNDFEWERYRIYFTGWLWEKNLKYVVYLDGSTNRGGNNVGFGDAYFDYQYAKDHAIQWGQFLLPFGKQGVNASTYNQMFVDYSIAHATFQAGQSLGIMPHGDIIPKKLSYAWGVFNGANNSGNGSDTLDSRMATSGRLVYHAIPGYDEVDETDLIYHEKPAMDVGGSFLYNSNYNEPGMNLAYAVADSIRSGRGGYATSADRGSDVLQFGADVGFKYKGLSVTGEYYYRYVDSDYWWSPWNRLTVRGRGTGSPQGGYVQAGYFIIPKKLEVAARLAGVWGFGDDQCWEEAVGVNYYLKGQALKISADVSRIEEAPVTNRAIDTIQNDDMLMYRVQIQATMD